MEKYKHLTSTSSNELNLKNELNPLSSIRSSQSDSQFYQEANIIQNNSKDNIKRDLIKNLSEYKQDYEDSNSKNSQNSDGNNKRKIFKFRKKNRSFKEKENKITNIDSNNLNEKELQNKIHLSNKLDSDSDNQDKMMQFEQKGISEFTDKSINKNKILNHERKETNNKIKDSMNISNYKDKNMIGTRNQNEENVDFSESLNRNLNQIFMQDNLSHLNNTQSFLNDNNDNINNQIIDSKGQIYKSDSISNSNLITNRKLSKRKIDVNAINDKDNQDSKNVRSLKEALTGSGNSKTKKFTFNDLSEKSRLDRIEYTPTLSPTINHNNFNQDNSSNTNIIEKNFEINFQNINLKSFNNSNDLNENLKNLGLFNSGMNQNNISNNENSNKNSKVNNDISNKHGANNGNELNLDYYNNLNEGNNIDASGINQFSQNLNFSNNLNDLRFNSFANRDNQFEFYKYKNNVFTNNPNYDNYNNDFIDRYENSEKIDFEKESGKEAKNCNKVENQDLINPSSNKETFEIENINKRIIQESNKIKIRLPKRKKRESSSKNISKEYQN